MAELCFGLKIDPITEPDMDILDRPDSECTAEPKFLAEPQRCECPEYVEDRTNEYAIKWQKSVHL